MSVFTARGKRVWRQRFDSIRNAVIVFSIFFLAGILTAILVGDFLIANGIAFQSPIVFN
jgi:hypothetical protein